MVNDWLNSPEAVDYRKRLLTQLGLPLEVRVARMCADTFRWMSLVERDCMANHGHYRQLEQVRLRTTSTNPALRLMLAGLAVVLLNVWVWMHWQYLRVPGRGPRRVQRARLRLRRFQSFVLAAVTAWYGQLTTLSLTGSRPLSASDGQANL